MRRKKKEKRERGRKISEGEKVRRRRREESMKCWFNSMRKKEVPRKIERERESIKESE